MIYEYECKDCDKVWEVYTNNYDKEYDECHDCGKLCIRVISKNTFKLRGVGWAKDNYDSAEVKANVERNKRENEKI